jgi:hypothetical protein
MAGHGATISSGSKMVLKPRDEAFPFSFYSPLSSKSQSSARVVTTFFFRRGGEESESLTSSVRDAIIKGYTFHNSVELDHSAFFLSV